MTADTTKTKRPKKSDAGVLAALPSTRPTRLGRRAAPKADPAATAKAAADVKAAATSTKAASKTTAKTRPKAAAKATAKPKAATTAAARPTAAKTAGAKPTAPEPSAPVLESVPTPEPPKRPRAVRAGAPSLSPPAEAAERRGETESKSPGGVELVGTVVQAAGELAQIGLTVGGQILKRAVERLPKP